MRPRPLCAAFSLPKLDETEGEELTPDISPSTTVQPALLTVTPVGPKTFHHTLKPITRHGQEQQPERKAHTSPCFNSQNHTSRSLARFISWHTKTPRRQSRAGKAESQESKGTTDLHQHTYPTTRTAPGEQTEGNKLIKHQPATCPGRAGTDRNPDMDTNKQPTLYTPAPEFPECFTNRAPKAPNKDMVVTHK